MCFLHFACLVLAACAAQQNATSTWVKRNPNPTAAILSTVVYGAGKFVVAGTGMTNVQILYSDDALNWKEAMLPDIANFVYDEYQLYRVVFDEKIGFVAYYSRAGLPILTSPDGVTWTAHPNSDLNFGSRLVSGNGIMVSELPEANNNVMTRDGVHYTPINVTGRLFGFTDGKFISYFPDVVVYQSVDAISWSVLCNLTGIVQTEPPESPPFVSNVIRGTSGAWVAVLKTFGQISFGRAYILRSDDGNAWRLVTALPEGLPPALLVCINDVFILTLNVYSQAGDYSSYAYYRSVDGGRSWERAFYEARQRIMVAGDRLVTGFGGDLGLRPIPGLVQVSTDLGATWKAHNNGVTSRLSGLTCVDDIFGLATETGVYSSRDGGATWVMRASVSLGSMTYSDALKGYYGPVMVSALNESAFAVSSDLSEWTLVTGPNGKHIDKLVYWQAQSVVRATAGHWVVVIRFGFCCSVPTELALFVSDTSVGWRAVQLPPYVGVGNSGRFLVGEDGVLVLDVVPPIISHDSGLTWRRWDISVGNDGLCTLHRANDMWFRSSRFFPKPQTFYARDSNLSDWREASLPDAASVSWLAAQRKYIGGGTAGATWESTDGLAWEAGARLNTFSSFQLFASSPASVVAASPLDSVIFSQDE